MSLLILNKIKKILTNPTEMNAEKLKAFIEEMSEYFQSLQNRAASENLKEREKAIQEALDLKTGLEEQLGDLSKVIGLSPEQMMSLAASADHLNKSEMQLLEEAQKNLSKHHKMAVAQ